MLERQQLALRCRVLDGGTLGSRRHVNLPGVRVKLPSITQKDHEDIAFGIRHNVDFIAPSFVRAAADVLEVRRILDQAGSSARIIAKIENREGVDNFDAILEAADGIMVARGDLGVEVPIRELPVIQRRIVRACARAGKPVIVATHLLESMIKHPLPTRAEVTDVANAVYEQADALMLSGETSAGEYPVRCVQVLDDIARHIEKEPGLEFGDERRAETPREELARAAARLADSLTIPGDRRDHAPRAAGPARRGLPPEDGDCICVHQHEQRAAQTLAPALGRADDDPPFARPRAHDRPRVQPAQTAQPRAVRGSDRRRFRRACRRSQGFERPGAPVRVSFQR